MNCGRLKYSYKIKGLAEQVTGKFVRVKICGVLTYREKKLGPHCRPN